MACNCATSQQIKDIYERYSEGKIKSGENTYSKIVKSAVFALGILMIPFISLYVICVGIFSKEGKINISELLGLKKSEA